MCGSIGIYEVLIIIVITAVLPVATHYLSKFLGGFWEIFFMIMVATFALMGGVEHALDYDVLISRSDGYTLCHSTANLVWSNALFYTGLATLVWLVVKIERAKNKQRATSKVEDVRE